ncbi:serum opacification factor [Streptococcus dysgalactiae]|uniref:serum opacification factor n=1 Tax=Streptococcus dysgalactiae TaxID=1334 RepID=UPI003F53FB25
MKMSNCKYKLRKLSVGLVSVGTMFTTTTVLANEVPQPTATVSPVAVESSSEEVDTSESVTTSEIEKVLDTKNVHSEPKSITTNVESEQTFEATADSQEESASLQPKSRSKRSTDLVSQQPQLMEIEKLTVDNEKTEVNIKDEKDDSKKLIKNRDGEQREIVDISREVKVDESKNELEVTLTVTPKEIDRGAEVIVLLDTSKKMTEEDFNTAKENIKKLVTTLTSNSTTEAPNHNSRNSVRLIDFYRHIGEPVELTEANADEKLTQVRQNNGWGVDLQGAIHKAREIFSKEKKNSGKRQHIVLFSQGEATFSYDIKDKNKLSKTTVKEPVTSSNPLFPWPFYFDSTTNTANLVKDGEKIKNFLKKLGINRYEDLLDGLASNGNTFLSFGSDLLGTNNPLDYITLSDLDTKKLTEENFDYSKILGEGYNFRSYYTRESSEVPLKNIVRAAVRSKIEKLKEKVEAEAGWLDVLGITKWSNSISKALGFDQLEEQMINKVIDYLFNKRNYVYYNHNLSAQAEAKMARDEGIVFYAFDVTDPTKLPKAAKYNNHSKEYTEYLKKKEEEAKALYKKRNDEFDKYLKAMSDGQDFLKYVEDKDKFKDILEEVTVTETFEDKVTVAEPSHYKDSNGDKQSVKHTSSSSWFFSSTKESLTWTISKDELKKAFENEKPLTLTYKLKVNQVKFKEALSKARKKRSAATKSDDLLTESIISNKISYKINKKQANGKKLDDVKLTYGKEMVPVPEIDGEVIQPQIPQLPELPPVIEHEPNFDFTEDTVNQLPLEHGHYEPNTTITLTEDTKPESDTISISGQSDPIEITEDTLSNQSGHSNDDTTIEDTKQPEVIMGGQANIVDMVEETQPGMSGFNESTVIEENTRPKLQFHFDNEEPNPAINKAISQTPIARVDNNLPQTGDKDKSEAFFTITALTVIGAAGLLSKKDRKNQID